MIKLNLYTGEIETDDMNAAADAPADNTDVADAESEHDSKAVGRDKVVSRARLHWRSSRTRNKPALIETPSGIRSGLWDDNSAA